MTHAYDEMYLNDAMQNMGEMMDYAANSCGMDMDEYFALFMSCGIADQFMKGVPQIVSGMSGTELVWEVMRKTGNNIQLPLPQTEYFYTSKYWCGWILAYYQWHAALTFKEIMSRISFCELEKLYPTLHEASEERAADALDVIIYREKPASKIQTLRRLRGYSQRILAEKSGVNLRTLQQYESGAKNINKAAAESLLSMAKVLGCKIEDLLEK